MSESDAPQPEPVVEYPEHEKLDGSDAEAITRFLEWLQEHDLFVAKSIDGRLMLDQSVKPSRLITDFFGVDRDKLEAERRDMLNRLAGLN